LGSAKAGLLLIVRSSSSSNWAIWRFSQWMASRCRRSDLVRFQSRPMSPERSWRAQHGAPLQFAPPAFPLSQWER
jgi:hypothetical protein